MDKLRRLRDAKPGELVWLVGVVVGNHNGQVVVEFAAPDDAAPNTPVNWHITNGVGYEAPDPSELITRERDLLQAVFQKREAAHQATIAQLQEDLTHEIQRQRP